MIPRHRPPFDAISLLNTALRCFAKRQGMEDIERLYQTSLNVGNAVWLPSARFGITNSIQLNVPKTGTVVCPVFNCGAVFHAASECGLPVQFADCQQNSFLLDTSAKPVSDSAVILSEMFGQRFSVAELRQPLVSEASSRVFDMAMAIPTPQDMQRMKDADVTVLSFGLGKSLYAGWGGMALTHCRETAAELRRLRAAALKHAGLLSQTKWNAQLFARTVAHHPFIYGQIRQAKQLIHGNRNSAEEHAFTPLSHEWHRPPTRYSTTKSIENWHNTESFSDRRIQLCDEYSRQLQDVSANIQLPELTQTALSHYSVRVPQHVRTTLKQHLWNHRIDVGTLFPFPQNMCHPPDFPNAANAASEVMNLPLSNQLTRKDVYHICDVIKHGVTRLESTKLTNRAA